MPGNRATARTTQGRKRRAPAMQNQMEMSDPSENGCAPLPEKRRARGSGVAIQPAHSRTPQKQNVAMNTETTTRRFQTPMNPHDSFVKGESSSEASGFSSVEASTPNPQHQPLAFVKAEVYQEMNVMDIKDEAPQAQAAPRLVELAREDQECYRILHINLPRRLRHEFILNNEQVDLERLQPFEPTDSDFGNWTSYKILQFFVSIPIHIDLLNIYKMFKFPSQLIEHLHCRDLYIENQQCRVFWYELIGMNDEDYDKVLRKLWILKHHSEDGYEEWRGRDFNLKEEMNVGREEVVSLVYHRKEEDEEPKDRWSVDPEANLDEEEDEDEKQIVEKEGEVYLEPKFFEEAPMANANDAAPKKDQPAPELKCEQIQNHRNFHAHAQENSLFGPAPTAPTIAPQAPAPHPSEEQQGNIVLAPVAASMQRVLEMAAPVAYPAAIAQAPPQAGEQQGNRVPAPVQPDAPRFDAELFSELERLGILVPPLPADPVRIEVQAPPQIVEQLVLAPAIPDAPPAVQAPLLGGWQQAPVVLAPAIPDAPPAVQAPLLGGWQQALGVPAPAPPDAPPVALAPLQGGWQQDLAVPAPAIPDAPPVVWPPLQEGWQQALGYWAPPPQAAPPAPPAIPDAWIPRQEGAYGRMPMLCMAMQDLRRAQFQAALQQREQQFPGINAPPPAAAPPIAQHVRGLPQGVQHLRPGIFSPPLPAPAPIDQHLGVQAALRRGQHQFPGFQAPPPAAVPPMDPRVQAPPPFHPHSHLVLVPRDGQPYAPPPYRPLQ
ncbi:hypothetical protein CAEBREN_24336 [Caenorhabditis brenneri]|uniref:Uncharacterized protein n=1 Tax=Caenorhabditis brenneri TaxID=135651 RepID=G0N2E3_CAEBE|nr:hypothetical protein CAEBREN_24336 [Caenorhabditis brenneri]